MQTSFSELEYASKKKQTRRDRFLAETEAVTQWVILEQTIAPHYPRGGGCGRPPLGLGRMLRMYIAPSTALGFRTKGLLHGEEQAAYLGVEKRPESAGATVEWHVAEKRSKVKALAGTMLGDLVAQVEHAKASIRAKVEHSMS